MSFFYCQLWELGVQSRQILGSWWFSLFSSRVCSIVSWYCKEILDVDRRVNAHLFTIPAFFLITLSSFFLLFTFRAFLVRPASKKKIETDFDEHYSEIKKRSFQIWNARIPERNTLPVPRTSPAAGSPPLLSIARLFSLLFIPPLFGLVPWFVIPWGWWTAAASSPRGWPAVLTPAARSLFVVVSFSLVSRVSSFLPLVLGLDLSVCSGVRPASGAASSTTIISVVAVEISAAVRCGKNVLGKSQSSSGTIIKDFSAV